MNSTQEAVASAGPSSRDSPLATPACDFRMPAEWEPHESTWIAWPHHGSDWPGKFPTIPWVYGEIARKIVPGERLSVLVNSARHESRARRVLSRAGVDLSRVRFFLFPTNRGWTRDSGPLFVRRSGPGDEIGIVRFRFNGWAKYDDWDLDDQIPELAARALGYPLYRAEINGSLLVLEGGSIDVNGEGALLTTEECLLDREVQPRNPQLTQTQIETALRRYLGVREIIWLGKGIAGDDTHGHVDDVCRFTGPRTAVLCQEDDSGDANYAPLQENRERLEGARLRDSSRLEVVALPMPAPLYFNGQRLPASYANFYLASAAVLVPTFNDPKDRVALGILAELFRDRPVIGIHAVDLIWGLGTIHCLTQQQPHLRRE
ncbi:MAG: agmatine deiminase family protein [Terriglobia bacterium]